MTSTFRIFPTLFVTCLLSACGLSNVKSDADLSAIDEFSSEIDRLESEEIVATQSKTPKESKKSVAQPTKNSISDEKSVWERMRKGYQLPIIFNQRVNKEIKRYAKHQKYMDRVIERAEPYLFYIVEELEKRNMPLEIALLPIVESAFDPFARSHVNAAGIWQIMPRTGKSLGLKQNWWYDGRRDITESSRAAMDYLEQLNKRFGGDWLLALAAYNSGGGNVSKAIKKNKRLHRELDFWSLDLPKETKDYVPRLVALTLIISSPSTYNITLKEVENKPYLAKVDVKSQIDLAQAAELAEISMDDLYQLNPGLNQWATDPTGPHHLLLPTTQKHLFEEKLSKLPENKRITWNRYKIKKGDSLSNLAKTHQLSVGAIKELNGLSSTKITIGQTILLPKASQAGSHYSKSVSQRLARSRLNNTKKRGSKTTYTVKAGDSLWAISRRYGVSTKQIAKWNSSVSKKAIRPGQKLTLWSSKKITQEDRKKVSYKVKKGDTLSRIAARFNVAIKDIKSWNSDASRKYLQPGQALTLFVDSAKKPRL